MPTIIHIGYPKTATTWLQEEFFPKVNNFHFESWKVVNRHFLTSDSLNFDAQKTRDKITNNSKTTNILLSSEFLTTAINFGWHSGNYSIACAHKLKATFPDAKIVIFLRRQQSLICSAYLQYIKNGGTYSYKRWLYSGDVFSFEHLLFNNLIELYDNLFGKENVKIYLFEDFKLNKISFLEQFKSDLELDVEIHNVSVKPINVGLRYGVVGIQRFLNLFYRKPIGRKVYILHIPGMTAIARQIMKRINKYSLFGKFLSDKNMLTQKDIDTIKSFYAESNKKLATRINGDDLRKHGYYLD